MKTLRSKSMLVSLKISQWGNRKNEKSLASELSSTHNTEEGFLSVSKSLVGREKTKAIASAIATLRDTFNKETLPWDKTGRRIIEAKKYFAVSQKIAERKREVEKAIEDLIAIYPQLVDEARRSLNGLFKPEQYPTVQELRRKYAINVDFDRITDTEDFRIDGLDTETVESIQKQVEQNMKEKLDNARNDMCERMVKVVSHFLKLMEKTDGRFRKNSITNIGEMADEIREFNGLIDDPRIENLATKLEELAKLDADVIRANDHEREAAAKKAKETLDSIREEMKDLM